MAGGTANRQDVRRMEMSSNHRVMFPIVLFLAALFAASAASSATLATTSKPPFVDIEECNSDLALFLACNDKLVKNYLESLPNSSIGKVIPGVKLTDGKRFPSGRKYLGKAKLKRRGAHVHLFREGAALTAVLWVDHGGEPIKVPRCPEGVSPESAYVLSGDVFTWTEVTPSSPVVETKCLDNAWQSSGDKVILADPPSEDSSSRTAPVLDKELGDELDRALERRSRD